MNNRRYLDEKNALALLPIPHVALDALEEMLQSIDAGQHGGIEDCISKLVKINKTTRHGRKPWGRLKTGKRQDFLVTYKFIYFDEQNDDDRTFYSYEAWKHGTPQSSMLMCNFERLSGTPPAQGLQPADGTRVLSRRIFSIPLQCVLKHWGNVESGHMIYEHNISAMDFATPQFKSASYIGLTSRNWQTRYKEHQRDALTGSELLFHTSLNRILNCDGLVQAGNNGIDIVRTGAVLLSELQYINLTFEEAMQIEEKMVERSLHPNGLNMIPGGFAGMKYLHSLGYLNKSSSTLEERDKASARFLLDSNTGDRFAPWVKESWLKDEYYEKVIFGRINTLNREQVLSIRKFGNEWGISPEIISQQVGASLRQVKDVLSDKYYSRVS